MPDEPRTGLAGYLGQILGYIDRPWKVAAVILLFVIGGVGWIVYEQRSLLLEAWLTPDSSELKTGDVPDALVKLTEETSADLVQIWQVDLSKNSQWFVGARRHDGERPVIPSPRRLPVLVTASDLQALINVMEGHPICVDLSAAGAPLARRLAERGMSRGCAIPIPPNPEFFVGVIYLAWATAVDDSSERVAVGAAKEISRKLATH